MDDRVHGSLSCLTASSSRDSPKAVLVRALYSGLPFLHRDDHADTHVQLARADEAVKFDQLLVGNLRAAAETAERVAEGDHFCFENPAHPFQSGDDELLSLAEKIRVNLRVGGDQIVERDVETRCNK